MIAVIGSAAFADPQPQSGQSRVRRLALSLCPLAFRVSENTSYRKLSFRESQIPEAQLPRIPLLGNPVNRGKQPHRRLLFTLNLDQACSRAHTQLLPTSMVVI